MVTKKKKSYGSTVSHAVSNAFFKNQQKHIRARVLQLTVWSDSLWHKMLLNKINGIMYTHIHAYGKPYLVPLWPLFGFMDFQSEKKT